jgi:hypothetical protein
MTWVTAIVKAILEWLTAEVKKDTKAADADTIPKGLKDKWRDRINKQLEKAEQQKKQKAIAENAAIGHQGHQGHQGYQGRQGRQDENN